jgi:hypothetical protein
VHDPQHDAFVLQKNEMIRQRQRSNATMGITPEKWIQTVGGTVMASLQGEGSCSTRLIT